MTREQWDELLLKVDTMPLDELKKIIVDSARKADVLQTNADRIRQMTDEELANQLVSEQYVAMKMVFTLLCQKLKDEEILDEKEAKELFCNFENEAKKKWCDMLKEKLDWLKAPVEDSKMDKSKENFQKRVL